MESTYLISFYFIPSVIGFAIAFLILFLGGTEEEEQEHLERLADRLRRLYEHTGQPGLRGSPSETTPL